MNVSVSWDNAIDVLHSWDRAVDRMGMGCVNSVGEAIREAVIHARTTHKFKNQTGELEKSIHGEVTKITHGGRGAEGYVEARSDHASYVEDDTRAHVIRPKTSSRAMGPLLEGQSRRKRGGGGGGGGGGVLSWIGANGARRFARSVNHPGTKGQPFMGPAYFRAEQVGERVIEEAVPAAQREIER